MDTLIKLNSTRVGRDKIFRTLQYALRAINSRPYLATDESRDLEKTLASFRKLLRLGTFIDVLQSARQSVHHPDFCTRILVTLARIANAMYLLGDHIVWLHRNNLLQMKDIKGWERFSNKSWLYSIILNLITDYRAIKSSSKPSTTTSSTGNSVHHTLIQNHEILSEILQPKMSSCF